MKNKELKKQSQNILRIKGKQLKDVNLNIAGATLIKFGERVHVKGKQSSTKELDSIELINKKYNQKHTFGTRLTNPPPVLHMV